MLDRVPNRRSSRLATLLAAILACAVLIASVGPPIPIVIWDEGRIIVNAMEMHSNGLSLVTTYDGHQDLWNTKPPLFIWLLDGSLALFGPREWALRLPSLLASLGTIVLVVGFLRRIGASVAAALFGGLILATSIGFFGEHGARTADYDALLCLETTTYLMALFVALQRRRPSVGLLGVAAVAAAMALMTKGIAGAVPGAGFGIFVLASGRWRRLLQSPLYAVAAILALVPVAVFLIAREAVLPGYLHAMIFNDVSGRFGEALDAHGGPPWYYLSATFMAGLFSIGPAALLAPLAIPIARGRPRQALVFSCCVALGQLIVVSASATKLTHYFLSAYPFVAIAVAIATETALRCLAARIRRTATPHPSFAWIARGALALIVAHGLFVTIYLRQTVMHEREHYARARYGLLLAALGDRRAPILLFERGVWIPDDPHYAPELRFYAMAARENGRRIEQPADPARLRGAAQGEILASCDPGFLPMLHARGANLVAVPGCVAVSASRGSPSRASEPAA